MVINQNKKGYLPPKEALEKLKIPSSEDFIKEILQKAGPRPPLPPDLPQGSWGEQALTVLSERYLRQDEKEEARETPEEMIWRVAWEIASAEVRWKKEREEILGLARQFYLLMISKKFLPNSPTLMNAGTDNTLQYSACFVLPVEDSIEAIYDALKYQALIHKTGGGTGFSFSRLRPRGSLVTTSSGISSGPVSFMKIFDASTNEIKQGGKRRGANMGILRVDHPDILEFIHCKQNGGINNFNISVAVSDRFMESLNRGENYELFNPRTNKVCGHLSAKVVFEEICQTAWQTGDPGLVFIDRINQGRANPVPSLGPIEATNPCGEQPLYPFDACNLGSLFLTYFIKEAGNQAEIDWESLKQATRLAVRFLDNVIEVNPFTLEQIKRVVWSIRRIGLGVGGWADMLIKLGLPYDSPQALKLAEKVMKTIQEEAVAENENLAKERGFFPFWPQSIYKNGTARRNATITTIAPTGTISIIAGASSGIEPLFAVCYHHIVKDESIDRELTFFQPDFTRILEEKGLATQDMLEKIKRQGIIRNIQEIPEEIRAVFGTALEIAPEWHVKMQAAFQKYTDNAVSKTVNLVNSATVEDVKKVYLLAWEVGCKGITIYRDKSKNVQVLNISSPLQPTENKVPTTQHTLGNRPIILRGRTYKMNTPVGEAFITINRDESDQPFEVFVTIGKAGMHTAADAEAMGRIISLALRVSRPNSKVIAQKITSQLKGIGGYSQFGFGKDRVMSLADGVAKALAEELTHLQNQVGEDPTEPTPLQLSVSEPKLNINSPEVLNLFTDLCPECGQGSLVFEEGCKQCHSCGYSQC